MGKSNELDVLLQVVTVDLIPVGIFKKHTRARILLIS